MNPTLTLLTVLLLAPLAALHAAGRKTEAAKLQLPALNWEQRSDWFNVKQHGAVGDGVADDTAAIQALYDRVTRGEVKTVYFPPGRYRITKTLTIKRQKGVYLAGHGRDTVLEWDGEKGGTMYWSDGVHRSRYEGLTYDGKGKAGIASEHRSMNLYETHLIYQHCAFRNSDYGIAVSKNPRKNASAEIWFHNLLFENDGTGVLFNEYNDYDDTLDGCVFVGCGTGIDSRRGHFHVRNSHFLRSAQADVRVGDPQHPGSLRWCTSSGSRRFLEIPAGSNTQPFTVQNCLVSGWRDVDGAVFLGRSGPSLIFDTVFTDGPAGAAPIRLACPAAGSNALVLSNNQPAQRDRLVRADGRASIVGIPAGKSAPPLRAGMGWCFTGTVSLPGKIFDARKDFGAKGDGKSDDTQAIQATIDAAREHGNRALAYFPAGTYNLTRTLQVHGRNYAIGGTGLETTLRWRGPLGPAVMEVKDPQEIAIEHLTVASDNDGVRVKRGTTASGKKASVAEFFKSKTPEDRIREHTGNVKIRQTGEAKQSSIYYNGLYLTSTYDAVPGIEFVNLPPRVQVRIGVLYGCLHFSDSAQATALASVHYGRLVVDGAKLPKSGFIGMLFHNDVHRDFALTVKDNQDLVVADFYQEQNERHLLLEGGQRTGKGHVTIGSSKIASVEPGFVTVHDYEGRVWISGGSVQYPTPGAAYQNNPIFLAHTGKRPLDFILAATHFFQRGPGEPDPIFNFTESVRFASIENSCGSGQSIHPLPTCIPEGSLQVAAEALDDFREIGRINLRLNYPDNLSAQ